MNEFLASSSNYWSINLLESDTALRYLKEPAIFRKEVKERLKSSNGELSTIFIDEIQKIPALLDEVQLLMDSTSLKFILTGSSARKLKRGGANLLGGRAVERHLFPFLARELGDKFDLDMVLRYGALPKVILSDDESERIDILNSYLSTYLREEVQQEAMVRNVSGFITFLEVAAQHSGELLNFSAISNDAGISARTVQNYYQILEDTLIGLRLPAYRRSVRKRLRFAPKFYLFDIGVRNALERQLRSSPDATRYGKLFEQFIVLETVRTVRSLSPDGQVFFWRTKDDLEVDLLVESRGALVAAIEIKSSETVTEQYLKGLFAFHQEHPTVPCYVIARVPQDYSIGPIKVLSWQSYITLLEKWL